ncbi:MAG: MoaD/ThiS family protein [Dehalococcoidia bacterium]|nr:MoaD/ThiS family protein [Dehalococcoidia bacterium]
MAVKVKLSPILAAATGRQELIEVPARSPVDCLHDLRARFPRLKRWLFDRHGNMRPQLWLFVNGQRVHVDDLNTPLKDGDELLIMLAISGG